MSADLNTIRYECINGEYRLLLNDDYYGYITYEIDGNEYRLLLNDVKEKFIEDELFEI